MKNNNVSWAIQTKIGNTGDTEKLVACLEALNIPYEMIDVVPFSDDAPVVKSTGNIIFYGSTTLIKNVHKAQQWKPGVWFNPKSYEYENILKGYRKENLLNGDSVVMTVKELLEQRHSDDHILFVRPAADMKEFTGAAMEFQEIKQWSCLESSQGPFTLDTKIQVAEPKNIHREFRTVVIDKKVVASSQYKRNGRLNIYDDVPASIINYANDMAKLHQPQPVFILDVCELTNGDYKIVETNTFNAAGFYYMDYYEIVKQVTEFTREHY